MLNEKIKLELYCDSSGLFDQRYQTVAAISATDSVIKQLRNELSRILKSESLEEIKFVKVRRIDSREYRATVKYLNTLLKNYLNKMILRVDVLTWDTSDSRHGVPGRDDIANLGRMYYRLLLDIAKRWQEAEWSVTIDNDEKVDFDTLLECLNSKIHLSSDIIELIESSEQLKELDAVKSIREVASRDEPVVQAADIFAGMARFSCENGQECCSWLSINENPDQFKLDGFFVEDETRKTNECRFRLIGDFYLLCKSHRLFVSLNTRKRLWTRNPNSPINFWYYEPQGDYDKAPTN